MIFGSGKYAYQVVEDWGKLPAGWKWGIIPTVACDSGGRVFVGSRNEHPLTVFDSDGNFLDSWGEDFIVGAHGLYIDGEDNVYCTVHKQHCIYKFDRNGKLLMTLGTPDKPAEREGDPFNKPTDLAIASTGELFVSDGYANARVHKYSPDGQLLHSWGEPGSGPGQFDVPHGVRVDRFDRVWISDRENHRIQFFDTDGNYLDEWSGLARPNMVYFDPNDDIVYIADLVHEVSIYTFDHQLIAQWGGGRSSDTPGEFLGGPHGIAVDARGDLYVAEALVAGRLQKFVRQESSS